MGKGLLADCEPGYNDEYSRAILKLITDVARITQNDRSVIAELIGTDDCILDVIQKRSKIN